MIRRAASVGFVVMLIACTHDFDGLVVDDAKAGPSPVDNGDDDSCACACKGGDCSFTCPDACAKCSCDCPAGTQCIVGSPGPSTTVTCEKDATCSCKGSSCTLDCVAGKTVDCDGTTACNSCSQSG